MAHPRITGFLARAVSQETGAVQQLMTQARLTEAWGWDAFGRSLRNGMNQAMVRVERLISQMLYHGVTPNATQLTPARVGRSRAEILEINWQSAQAAARLYEEAAQFCARQRAPEDEALFRALLEEQAAWLRQIESDLTAVRSGGGGHG